MPLYNARNVISESKDIRGGSRAAATSKMKRFVIIVNGFQPLTILTKHSILDVATAQDPPLILIGHRFCTGIFNVISVPRKSIGWTRLQRLCPDSCIDPKA